MKFQLFLAGVVLLLITSCTKNQELDTSTQQALSSKIGEADVVYHYKGQAYAFTYEEGSREDFVEDDEYLALQEATSQSDIVTFTYSNKPVNHVYLFDSEFEGYDFIEKDGRPLIGRKFKMSLRIDQLRESLISQFGLPLDFKRTDVAEKAQKGIKDIYQELKIITPFPNDVEAFIGVETNEFTRQKTGSAISSEPVLTVWEHADAQGSEMYVEQAPTTVIWNYGSYNCYTMAANPDLTLEFQPNGNNWNDCISSKCLSYVQGADAMAEGYYKDANYPQYGCAYTHQITYTDRPNPIGPCWNMSSTNWPTGPFCGHMNDQVSSIRVKAIWQGCTLDFSDI